MYAGSGDQTKISSGQKKDRFFQSRHSTHLALGMLSQMVSTAIFCRASITSNRLQSQNMMWLRLIKASLSSSRAGHGLHNQYILCSCHLSKPCLHPTYLTTWDWSSKSDQYICRLIINITFSGFLWLTILKHCQIQNFHGCLLCSSVDQKTQSSGSTRLQKEIWFDAKTLSIPEQITRIMCYELLGAWQHPLQASIRSKTLQALTMEVSNSG